MRTKLLQDAIQVAIGSNPPPAFSDETAAAAGVGTLATGLTHVAYDAIESDAPKAMAACQGAYSESEVEHAYASICQAAPGKIGDGSILKFLQSVDWAKLIQTIVTIISVLPKSA